MFHPISYNEFYYSNLCHVCKKYDQNLKRCSTCKSFAYCSKDHQKLDWKYHKEFCKVVAEGARETLKKYKASDIKTFATFKEYKTSLSVMWHNKLGRGLKNFENQVWMFPRVCAVCYSNCILINCENCLNVSYCSDVHEKMHREQHSKFCDALKLCMEIDRYYFHNEYKSNEINVSDFGDDISCLPNSLKELMLEYDKYPLLNSDDEKIQFIIKSDHVAPAATVLYGLEKSGLIQNRRFVKNSLTIHIVGADVTEMCWSWKIMTELPFHWIKNINRLEYVVVGPELGYNGSTNKFAAQLCPSCRARNITTSLIFHSEFYHNVVDRLEKPDIVVAFNSGMHYGYRNTWDESIRSLTKYTGVPLILTEYTQNKVTWDVWKAQGCSSRRILILEPQPNPFSNMKPIRDFKTENVPLFYINGYIAILIRKERC